MSITFTSPGRRRREAARNARRAALARLEREAAEAAEQARKTRAASRTPLSKDDWLQEVTERAHRGDTPGQIAAGLSVTASAVYARLLRYDRLDLWKRARSNENWDYDWKSA